MKLNKYENIVYRFVVGLRYLRGLDWTMGRLSVPDDSEAANPGPALDLPS